MKKVCIIQPVMKGYRTTFFEDLSLELRKSNIDLVVVFSDPWREEEKRKDHVDLAPPLGLKVKSWMLFRKLYVQALLSPWINADLVIVEHANKHALNLLLLIFQMIGIKKVAYWGHGRDRQSSQYSKGELFKRFTLHQAYWWFAYTEGASDYIRNQGFDRKHITVVQNSIDTKALKDDLISISEKDKAQFLESIGWGPGSRISIYCGSFYENKRLDLLINSAIIAHQTNPRFHLLLVGGGPLLEEIQQKIKSLQWIKALGPKFGRDKALAFSVSEMVLNPGLVGLGIVDSFCAGLPFLTTDLPIHSPEIEYLDNRKNGLILESNADSFANGILNLLANNELREKLSNGAHNSYMRYSLQAMVGNFTEGVKRCLDQ